VTGRTRLSERGLTLVEVLLAVAVVGVAVAGVGVVVPVSSYGVQEGNQLSAATFLAEQMVERARAATWTVEPAVDCLGASVGDTAPVPTGATCLGVTTTQFPDETAGVRGAPQYRRTVRISRCETGACAGMNAIGLRLVEVTVDYTPLSTGSVAGGVRTVQLAWLASQK
jgi:prepilin-type N-terminal cleavage/methylation domain-containing protein